MADDEDPNKWALSPVLGLEQCQGTHMKIETTPVGEVSFEGMGNKYCFSMKAIKSWQVCHHHQESIKSFGLKNCIASKSMTKKRIVKKFKTNFVFLGQNLYYRIKS